MTGPGFDSQTPTDRLITICNSTSKGSDAPFKTLQPGTQVVQRHTCRQNIHAHKIKFRTPVSDVKDKSEKLSLRIFVGDGVFFLGKEYDGMVVEI